MNVTDRIKQYQACEAIDLTREERDAHYTGAGWKLARFESGVLAGMFDPMNCEVEDSAQRAAEVHFEAAFAWLANAEGDVWLVMCSAGQLCEPRRITMSDASALAHMARVIGEQAVQLYED